MVGASMPIFGERTLFVATERSSSAKHR